LATLILEEIGYKRDLSVLGRTININTLNDWKAKFEELHRLFLLRKKVGRYPLQFIFILPFFDFINHSRAWIKGGSFGPKHLGMDGDGHRLLLTGDQINQS